MRTRLEESRARGLMEYALSLVKPMYEAVLMGFSSIVTVVAASGITMTVEELNILHFSTIALTLALLTARIASKKDGSFFKWFVAGAIFGIIALPIAIFKRKHDGRPAHESLMTLKTCPNCAEQLPLAALVCGTCDYNFLSMTVGYRHKLLPAPNESPAQESSRSRMYQPYPQTIRST
jgi:hypothetical protein